MDTYRLIREVWCVVKGREPLYYPRLCKAVWEGSTRSERSAVKKSKSSRIATEISNLDPRVSQVKVIYRLEKYTPGAKRSDRPLSSEDWALCQEL